MGQAVAAEDDRNLNVQTYAIGFYANDTFLQAVAVPAPDDETALLRCIDCGLLNGSSVAIWQAERVVYQGPIQQSKPLQARIADWFTH